MRFKNLKSFVELTDDPILTAEIKDYENCFGLEKSKLLIQIYISGLETIDSNKTIAIRFLKGMLINYPEEVVKDWFILMSSFKPQIKINSNTPKRIFNYIILSKEFLENITIEAGDLLDMKIVEYIMNHFGEIDFVADKLDIV